MGVPLDAVARILDDPDELYPGAPTRRGTPTTVAVSSSYPDWIVVHLPGDTDEPPYVLTVAFETGGEPYRRVGGGFELLDEETREAVRRWSC